MPWIVGNHPRSEPAYMADMRAEGGETLRPHSETLGTRTAVKAAEQIAELPAYQALITLLPSEKVALFFEKRVKDATFPAIRDLCLAQWYSDNEASQTQNEIVWRGNRGLGLLLQSVWPSQEIPLRLGSQQRSYRIRRPTLARLYRKARRLGRQVQRTFTGGRLLPFPTLSGPTIAAHYAQGLDPARRSDLFWYPASRVDPGKVLILLDNVRSGSTGRRVPDTELQTIEGMRMNWVCLEHDVLERKDVPAWARGRSQGSLLADFKNGSHKPAGPTEHWVTQASKWLLREVDYWASFYRAFGIKVHMDIFGGEDRHVAQNIALDLTDGVRIGWQHAELHMAEGVELGFFPNHVRFTWNARAESYAERNRNRISSLVISGFPYGGAVGLDADCQELRPELAANGANFVVAFFDNSFVWDGPLSKGMVLAFYEAFLRWVLEDPNVGIITKSKRPNPLQHLPEMRGLMDAVEATGRWIDLTDVYGRLPLDASRVADISVGIGISSAVSEAVATGGRGVHCDVPFMRTHPFYEGGYEKVVFDNLERMMAALKRYKADPSSEPELGDFSGMMDQVDPFHDGRAGERIGDYIRWLLEGFETGNDRDTAIREANEKYCATWGQNKVISFEVPV